MCDLTPIAPIAADDDVILQAFQVTVNQIVVHFGQRFHLGQWLVKADKA